MNSIHDRKPLQTDRPSLVSFCYFQAESSPGLSEADVEEGLSWHVRGPSRLYLHWDNCDVHRVRKEHLRLYLIFTNKKMRMYGKQNTFSHKQTISTCCHHSVVNIFLKLISLSRSEHSFPPPPIKVTIRRWCETWNKSLVCV